MRNQSLALKGCIFISANWRTDLRHEQARLNRCLKGRTDKRIKE